jgi:exopolyphosphatase/pppGpp-phosphohydrolase
MQTITVIDVGSNAMRMVVGRIKVEAVKNQHVLDAKLKM